MDEYNEIIRKRLKKLESLREKGIEPFPNQIDKTHQLSSLKDEFGSLTDKELESLDRVFFVAGRVMAVRKFGKASFVVIQDATERIQLFLEKDRIDEEYEFFKEYVDIGDFLGASGKLFRTRTGELTISADHIRLVTKSLRPLPEKWHGLTDVETRYRQRYVDLLVNEDVRDIFRKRARVISYLRDYLTKKDFVEVETPMMQPIPGGAAARPFTTHHNALGMDLFLRIAPELYLKRLLVGGFERVFEINRNFRNEGISTQHNPEFTMLEFYQAYATFDDLMELTEEMFSGLVEDIFGTSRITYQGTQVDFSPPWERITMKEAIIRFGKVSPNALDSEEGIRSYAEKIGIKVEDSDSAGKILSWIFEEVAENELTGPVFVYGYPVEVSPLSRKNDHAPDIADRFELIICGREVANAFSELNDPVDQRKRFLQQGKERERGDEEAHLMDEDYIRALEYGMPPAAGEGIGIDRLVMLLTDSPSIREVILFPLLRPEKGR